MSKLIRVIAKAKINLLETKDEKGNSQDKGIIEAYVSIFDNVDLGGDKIIKGAFAESLKTKLPKGVWMHKWEEPIAKTLEAREDDNGLYIKGKLVLGVQRAKEAYELLKEGVVDEFSIGYRVLDDEWDENGNRILKKLRIYEWSPVLVGMNPETELISVKSDNKGIIEDELNYDKADQNKKWYMIDAMDNVVYKFFEVYMRATSKSSDFKKLIIEVCDLLKKIGDNYEEITGSGKQIKEGDRSLLKRLIEVAINNKEESPCKEKQVNYVDVDAKKQRVKIYFSDGTVERKKLSFKYKTYLALANKEPQKGQKVEGQQATLLKLVKRVNKDSSTFLRIVKNNK